MTIATTMTTKNQRKFTDLPWEHVICRRIFPFLNIPEVFRLRGVSKDFKKMVQLYFDSSLALNLVLCSGKINAGAFQIISENTYCLKILNLSNSRNWLTNNCFIPVLKRNEQLSVINLAFCSTLTNVILQAISSNCVNIRTLILRDCHWVNDEGLLCIALKCEHLIQLDLTGCWNIGNNTIRVALGKLRNLEHISLAKIYSVTDETLMVIAQTCTQLRHLNICGCWRITNDAIWLLGEYSKCLRLLQVKDCRDINENSLSRLRSKKVRIDVPPPLSATNLACLSKLSLNDQT